MRNAINKNVRTIYFLSLLDQIYEMDLEEEIARC